MLKLRNDMIKESGRVSDLESGLKNNGFLYDKNLGYTYPIIISNSDIALSACEMIKEKIKQLDEMFERLLI